LETVRIGVAPTPGYAVVYVHLAGQVTLVRFAWFTYLSGRGGREVGVAELPRGRFLTVSR
jgi:hypothetical protein